MKSISVFQLCAMASLVASAATLQAREQVPLVMMDNKIPGESPVEICAGSSQDDFILHIDKIDLSPNPPRP